MPLVLCIHTRRESGLVHTSVLELQQLALTRRKDPVQLWGLGQCCSRSALEEQLDRPWPQRDPRLSSWEAPPGQRLQLHLLEYSCQHYQGFRDCKACTPRSCLVIAMLMVTVPASSPSITVVSQNRCADSGYHMQPASAAVWRSGSDHISMYACRLHKSGLVMSMSCGSPTMVEMSGCRRPSGSELTVQLGTLHRGLTCANAVARPSTCTRMTVNAQLACWKWSQHQRYSKAKPWALQHTMQGSSCAGTAQAVPSV